MLGRILTVGGCLTLLPSFFLTGSLGEGPDEGGTIIELQAPIRARDVAAGDDGLSALVTDQGELLVWGAESPSSSSSLPLPTRAEGISGDIGDIASWDSIMFAWVTSGPVYWWDWFSAPTTADDVSWVDAAELGAPWAYDENGQPSCTEKSGFGRCLFDEATGEHPALGMILVGQDGIPEAQTWGTPRYPGLFTWDGTLMETTVAGGAGWISLDPSGKIWETTSFDSATHTYKNVSWTTYGDEDARFTQIYGQPGIGFGITTEGVVWSWATPPWRGARDWDGDSRGDWFPASPMILGRPGFMATPDLQLNEIMAPVDTTGSPMAGARIQHLSVSHEHVLALAEDGRVFAWGQNDRGQLGNPSVGPEGTTSPVEVGLGVGATVLFGSEATEVIETPGGTGVVAPAGLPGTVDVLLEWAGRTYPLGEFEYLEGTEVSTQDEPQDAVATPVPVEPQSGSNRRLLAYILLGVAVVSAAGAVTTGVLAYRSKT